MKLKMRFDKNDMIKFGIYAFILFIMIAVLVSNLVTFADEGRFAGFNFFTALKPDYLASTIVIFLLALFGLVFSCKSYFFEFDKGFGFTTEKKLDGYSNWCDKKTMKKELKPVLAASLKADAAGIPLINDGKTLWVDDGQYHNLIIGSTGSGKTQCIIFPMVQSLAKHSESMVITDPKGEIYEQTGEMLRRRGYNIVLLNFRNPQHGNAWNPLTLPYRLWNGGNQDKAIELLDDLALNILYDESNKNADPFWEKTSAGYFAGLALGLFEDAKEEEININSISLMTTVGEDKFRGSSTYIKEYFNSKDPAGAAYINASSTILSPSDTKGSILAVFKEKIKLFATRANLSEMLSHSDFEVQDIGLKPTAVFIVIQDEKKTYHSLATILVKQIYETLIDVAQAHGGKLPVRTNFLLDEFANMPPLKDVTTMITAARSRQMRFTLIIQNFAQLNEVYGEQNAETIKGNCGNLVYLISTELKALEEISKMCGEVKSKKDDKTTSTPLVTISDLQKLSLFEVIIRRVRLAPFKTKLTPNYQMNWGKKYPTTNINDVPERERHEVEVFDVRKFVDEKVKKNKDNLLDFGGGGGGGLPFFNNMPSSNPFMNPFDMPPSKPKNPAPTSKDTDFDVDDIVKKIDAKIAQLEKEEEEAKKQEAMAASGNKKEPDLDMNTVINSPKAQAENNNNLDMIINNSKPVDAKPIEEKPIENKPVDKTPAKDEKDDDFFDDFFDE
jgi:type IV secretion system protein VirD4